MFPCRPILLLRTVIVFKQGVSVDITAFLASVADSFRSRYLTLNLEFERAHRPAPVTTDPSPASSEPAPESIAPADTYEPSAHESAAPPDSKDPATNPITPATPNPVEKQPDGTYFYQRRARLDYRLDLSFDLAALTQTVEKLAEGDPGAVEQLTAAGFGLSADFDAKGFQQVRTNTGEDTPAGRQHQLAHGAVRNSGRYLVNSRDFAMDVFFNEATRIHRNLNESAQGAHRQAVNKFALRFHADNRFSFAFLERFNVQTEQMNEEQPEALSGYLNSAGEVASGGTNDMMAAFLDAVDGYLDDTAEAMLNKVSAFFDLAAEELGFSGDMVAQARESLTGTIEAFFQRVDEALAQLKSQYAPVTEPPPVEARADDVLTGEDQNTLAAV